MAIVNAFLLYRESCLALKVHQKKQIKLSEFKSRIAKTLLLHEKSPVGQKRGRPSFEEFDRAKRKKANRGLLEPEDDVRFDRFDHFPDIVEEVHRCKQPKCTRRVSTKCMK